MKGKGKMANRNEVKAATALCAFTWCSISPWHKKGSNAITPSWRQDMVNRNGLDKYGRKLYLLAHSSIENNGNQSAIVSWCCHLEKNPLTSLIICRNAHSLSPTSTSSTSKISPRPQIPLPLEPRNWQERPNHPTNPPSWLSSTRLS